MKITICSLLAISLFATAPLFADEGFSPKAWARQGKDHISLTPSQDGHLLHYSGWQDWAVELLPKQNVRPRETYTLSCELGPGAKSGGKLDLSVILRDARNDVISWTYATRAFSVPETRGTRSISFAIPPNGASVEARLVGGGIDTDAFFANAKLVKTGELPALPDGSLAITNETLIARVDGSGGLGVTDRKTGRVWEPAGLSKVLASDLRGDGKSLSYRITCLESLATYQVLVAWADRPGEFLVSIDGDGKMERPFDYPQPFATREGDRLIVPVNEGMGYPVDEQHEGMYRLIAYGGHGICMSFFGVAEDDTGAGWMCILETPDDAAMNVYRVGRFWVNCPSWDPQRKEFGYTRKARYIFQQSGGHVVMAKRYRRYAQQKGLFKPFTEKVKKVPNIDRLLGAVNVWGIGWQGNKVELVKAMQDAGIERILWSDGGSDAEVKALSQNPTVLISRYDVYQDIYYPEQMKKLGWKGAGLNSDAYPHDIMWSGPSSNEWTRAWGVKAPDGTWTYCAMLCDKQAVKYERKNVTDELRIKPYNTRFIDTTVAAPWHECWNPAHPLTRSESRHWKMELLRILSDEFGLVVGSETGHDASVPFCDYYEGMLSIGPYRVPDSGRHIAQTWTNVPPRTAKYMVGERYRLPLWELVYHECVVAQWYWGDNSDKLPDLWHKKNLFNALYGTPPMFVIDNKKWSDWKDRFVESYRVTSPIARATGYSEMTDHRFLRRDRSVQQTVFANGVTVTVNFGNAPYRMADGRTLAASSYFADGLPKEAGQNAKVAQGSSGKQ